MFSTPAPPHYVNTPRRRLHLALVAAACGLAMPASLPAQSGPPAALATPVSSAIPRPPEMQRDVDFWIRIYTEVSTNEGLLHDEWDLSVVYARLQFPPDTTPGARRDAVDAARDRYVAALKSAAAALSARVPGAAVDAAALGADEQRVIAAWGAAATPERLLEAARGVRFQLGQADRFRAGIIRSGAWETHIAETFANLGLPPELAALPHVESSFTPSAYSKVGASGLWQFMRATGARYMRVDDVVDERLDPFRSTEAAAQLLSYNYRVLGTWPLALTAYNHGAAGMRRAKEAMGTDDIVTIARRYRGPTFGFASRNFFPSFLAALTIDQNPERYFGAIERAPEVRFREVAMPGYARLSAVERAVEVPRGTLRELNPALRPPVWEGTRLLPRGYRLRLPPSAGTLTTELLAERIGAGELYAAQIAPRSHRVGRGETLAGVAKRYGLPARALADLNGLQPNSRVKRGRVLRLPDSPPPLLAANRPPAAAPVREVEAVGPAPAGAPEAAPARIYVVRAGDTVFGVATKFGLSSKQLLEINRIRDADFIFEGQRLRVGADASPAVAAADGPQLAAAVEPATVAALTARGEAPPPARSSTPGATGTAVAATASSATAAAATSTAAPRTPEPVSAEGLGPQVGPGAGSAPPVADAIELAVRDGSVRVIAEETLGHYAEWLEVSAARLRELNGMKYGQAVLLGKTLKLDFSRVPADQFEARRREFHARLQAAFFAQRRILGTEVYIVRRGDSLWSITQRYAGVPVWLLQQYNPDLELGALRTGVQLVVPRLEDVQTSIAAGR
jgi:membrane-bound lytic murein transglycosylase D